jgi:hypothetical protein
MTGNIVWWRGGLAAEDLGRERPLKKYCCTRLSGLEPGSPIADKRRVTGNCKQGTRQGPWAAANAEERSPRRQIFFATIKHLPKT